MGRGRVKEVLERTRAGGVSKAGGTTCNTTLSRLDSLKKLLECGVESQKGLGITSCRQLALGISVGSGNPQAGKSSLIHSYVSWGFAHLLVGMLSKVFCLFCSKKTSSFCSL